MAQRDKKGSDAANSVAQRERSGTLASRYTHLEGLCGKLLRSCSKNHHENLARAILTSPDLIVAALLTLVEDVCNYDGWYVTICVFLLNLLMLRLVCWSLTTSVVLLLHYRVLAPVTRLLKQ